MRKCDYKQIELKSLENARRAACGVGQAFYHHQMAFLSHLPVAAVNLQCKEGEIIEKWSFIEKYLDALLLGFSHEEVRSFSEELTIGYFESIYFVALKRFLPIFSSD